MHILSVAKTEKLTEQATRRVLLNGRYDGDPFARPAVDETAREPVEAGELTAQQVLTRHCRQLYRRFGTYEEVARRAQLDRRTVKKYLQED